MDTSTLKQSKREQKESTHNVEMDNEEARMRFLIQERQRATSLKLHSKQTEGLHDIAIAF